MGASSSKDDGRNERLKAQMRYSMGDYGACAEMYEKLYEEDTEDVGLLVNALASRISAGQPAEGRLGDAEVRLDEAKQICVRELMQAEDVPEEDVGLLEDHEELAAIHVQRGCVLQRRGCTEEAQKLYAGVLQQRTGDAGEVDVTV